MSNETVEDLSLLKKFETLVEPLCKNYSIKHLFICFKNE